MSIRIKCDNIHMSLDVCVIEADGWHFEAKTLKGAINKLLKYTQKQTIKDYNNKEGWC